MRILIVKTSALGDIIQAFPVIEFLKKHFPKSEIHFAVLKENQELPLAHPLIDKVLVFSRKRLWFSFLTSLFLGHSFSALQKESYDLVFDLQGNLRSGLITFLAKSPKKVGFGKHSVAEWPNLLFTNLHYEVNKKNNIRAQYLSVVQKYFKLFLEPFNLFPKQLLKLNVQEKKQKEELIRRKTEREENEKSAFKKRKRILIAPFSKWQSKSLNYDLLISFLKKIEQKYQPLFLFLQGSETEKKKSFQLAAHFGSQAVVLDKMSLPLLQHLMEEVDLVIGMDSCPLHLAILAKRPTVGFFGPTAASIYGAKQEEGNLTFEGSCLLKLSFDKRCKPLRKCSQRCIDQHSQEELFKDFESFWQRIGKSGVLAGSGLSSL